MRKSDHHLVCFWTNWTNRSWPINMTQSSTGRGNQANRIQVVKSKKNTWKNACRICSLISCPRKVIKCTTLSAWTGLKLGKRMWVLWTRSRKRLRSRRKVQSQSKLQRNKSWRKTSRILVRSQNKSQDRIKVKVKQKGNRNNNKGKIDILESWMIPVNKRN